jgi:CheY-like chemotaxis protein
MSLYPADGSHAHQTLAGIAHEYNNLLTVIEGSLALAERHATGNAPLCRLLANMRVASERAAKLTERLVTLDTVGIDPAPAQAAVPEAPSAAGTQSVLVVEDDPNVAAVAVAVLENLGMRVERAASGAEALERIAAAPPFDLVFSDIVMPGGVSGLDLARRLEVSHPGVPVLLATGFSREALGVDALRFAVLPKPYSVAELGRRIQQMMAAGA